MSMALLSLFQSVLTAQSAKAWEIAIDGKNAMGDRQFIAYVGKVSSRSTFVGVGCTDRTLEVKILTDVDFDEDQDLRIRIDSKRAVYWSFYEGPTTSDGVIRSMELDDSDSLFKSILSSKSLTVQFFTYSGASIITKFNTTGTKNLVKGLTKAGCKV